MPAAGTPTLYEWAGGQAAFARLIEAFYDRVEADELGGYERMVGKHLGLAITPEQAGARRRRFKG